jgi:hypothetical protein
MLIGYSINSLIYILLFLMLAVFAAKFKGEVKNHSNESFEHHLNLVNSTVFFLFLSIVLKFCLSTTLFNYKPDSLPIYAISELFIVFCFSVFKTDEDCFKCFHRGDSETYSLFQFSSEKFYYRNLLLHSQDS